MGTLQGLAARRIDHIGIRAELPLEATYYPLGFQLEIATNSRDVLEAAAESWTGGAPLYPCEPLRYRVLVEPEGDLCPPPVHRMQEHLYSVIADSHNFAHVDTRTMVAFVHVSEKTAADHAWMRWFFVESLAYMMLTQRYVAAAHAACVALDGAGVLLCGKSGAGKSTLSYACARAGWTFVTDDCTFLLADSDSRLAIGRPSRARFRLDSPELFPELQPYKARVRPTGKVGIEVALTDFPHLRTAESARIEHVVLLDRGPGPAGAVPVTSEEAILRILGDMPTYGDAVDAMHDRTVNKLRAVPAWELRYERLDDAIRLLSTIAGT